MEASAAWLEGKGGGGKARGQRTEIGGQSLRLLEVCNQGAGGQGSGIGGGGRTKGRRTRGQRSGVSWPLKNILSSLSRFLGVTVTSITSSRALI